MNPINFQNRAIAYSVLAHIYDKATFASGPLLFLSLNIKLNTVCHVTE